MPLPFLHPPTAEDWETHQRRIALCRGSACFTALARHYGTDAPNQLEKLVDGRSPYAVGAGDKSWSGKYRRWMRDGKAPTDETVQLVWRKSGGKVDLQKWRDLPLWDLLDQQPPPIAELHRMMARFPAQIRRMLFGESAPNRHGRYLRFELGRDSTLALRNLGSLDAFQALLCLACEGEWISDDPRHSLPAMCAYDLFPRILRKHPELRQRWEDLYECLARIYWTRLYGDGIYFSCTREEIGERLRLLEKNRLATFPLLAGWRDKHQPDRSGLPEERVPASHESRAAVTPR